MKQSRRKELKTNELSLYLQEVRDGMMRHSSYIIGGIVVVVLILMIGLYVQHNRHETEAAHSRAYREIQQALMEGKTDVIDRASVLAGATADDARLGPQAAELYARLLYAKAMTISPLSESPERAELLDKSQKAYEALLSKYSDRADLVARTRLSLADVQETLYVAGKGGLEPIRELYREVVKAKVAPYAEMAASRLETLDARTMKLQVVATRPAEVPASAPASAPMAEAAPASAPAVASAPGSAPAAR